MQNLDLSEFPSLAEIGSGGLDELFRRALHAAIENMDDPNCEPTAKREITIKFKMVPDADARSFRLAYRVESKLAAPAEAAQRLHVVRERGKVCVYGTDPNQMTIDVNESN